MARFHPIFYLILLLTQATRPTFNWQQWGSFSNIFLRLAFSGYANPLW